MKIKRIDHIGIAVKDLDNSVDLYEKALGLKVLSKKDFEEFSIRIAFFDTGNLNIELIQPLNENSPIKKFIEKRGEGVHHICLEVENLNLAIEELKNLGITLTSDKPTIGAEGRPVAFISPKAMNGVLIELIE